jgi:hypothetical protein
MQDLERILEEYLVKDLEALRHTRVGYPSLMTVFAGVELLGSLLGEGEFGTDGEDFRHYWTKYLYPNRPRTSEEAEIIYAFVRHGVMHHFFPKGMVGVTGSDPGAHMSCRSDGILILDVKVLTDDFVSSYNQNVKPLLSLTAGRPSRVSMQKRLNDIRNAGAGKFPQVYKVFPVPPSGPPSTTMNSVTPTGISGPATSHAHR